MRSAACRVPATEGGGIASKSILTQSYLVIAEITNWVLPIVRVKEGDFN